MAPYKIGRICTRWGPSGDNAGEGNSQHEQADRAEGVEGIENHSILQNIHQLYNLHQMDNHEVICLSKLTAFPELHKDSLGRGVN